MTCKSADFPLFFFFSFFFIINNSIIKIEKIWILDISVKSSKRSQLTYKTLNRHSILCSHWHVELLASTLFYHVSRFMTWTFFLEFLMDWMPWKSCKWNIWNFNLSKMSILTVLLAQYLGDNISKYWVNKIICNRYWLI